MKGIKYFLAFMVIFALMAGNASASWQTKVTSQGGNVATGGIYNNANNVIEDTEVATLPTYQISLNDDGADCPFVTTTFQLYWKEVGNEANKELIVSEDEEDVSGRSFTLFDGVTINWPTIEGDTFKLSTETINGINCVLNEDILVGGTTITFTIQSNTAPVINSISPSTRTELQRGDTQTFTSSVTDDDGDASYSWKLDGSEVSTSSSYTIGYDDFEPGIYTLELNVSDAEFSDTASVTVELRTYNGGGSGGNTFSVTTTTQNQGEDNQVSTTTRASFGEQVSNFFSSIGNWFRGIFS